jgi:hypothetical protein
MCKITEMRVVRKNRKDGCENYLSVRLRKDGKKRTNRRPPIPIHVPTNDSQNSPNPLPLIISVHSNVRDVNLPVGKEWDTEIRERVCP